MEHFKVKGAIIKGVIIIATLAIATFRGTAAFCFVPDDPYYHSSGSWGQPYDDLWALKADKLDCEPAWDISQGEGVVVAIVDSGIDYTHADLNASIWINEKEIARNGKDDDANGYIDDIIGWNFIDNNNDVMDTIGHGSHCAGIIAAQGDNGKGIIGVAPKAKIMGIKAMTGEGESTVDKVVQAIKYAADNGADIINLSWGVPTRWWSPIPSLSEVINYAYKKGCVIICAAGNNNDDAAYYPPANYDNVIAVGATTQKDERCSFSNYGSVIDVVAPGGGYQEELGNPGKDDARNILTTVPQEFSMAGEYKNMKVAAGYYRFGGTSSAAPYVAGICALLKSIDPSLTNKEIKLTIETTADDLGTLGKDNIFGHGRVNAYRACQSVIGQGTTDTGSPYTPDTSTDVNSGTGVQDTQDTSTDTGAETGDIFGGLMGGGGMGGLGNMLGGLMGGGGMGGLGNIFGGLMGGGGMGGLGNMLGGLMGGGGMGGLGNMLGGLMGGGGMGGLGNMLGGLMGGGGMGGLGNMLGGLMGGGGMGGLFGGLMGSNTGATNNTTTSTASKSSSTKNTSTTSTRSTNLSNSTSPQEVTHIVHNGMHIWYPTNKQAGPYPLVVFSHGAVTGMPTHCPYLNQGLSEHGYVVCAIKHSEAQRVQEIKGEIDEMLRLNSDSSSPLYRMIDENAIGVCGHSMGGGTTAAICGASTNQQNADTRVKAGFCLEPFNMLNGRNTSQTSTPLMFVFGTNDFLAPASSNKFVYDNAPAPKYCAIVSGLGHIGAAFGSAGLNAIVGKYAVAFFDRYLKGNHAADQLLQTQDPAFASYEYEAGSGTGSAANVSGEASNGNSAANNTGMLGGLMGGNGMGGFGNLFGGLMGGSSMGNTPQSNTTAGNLSSPGPQWQQIPAYGTELGMFAVGDEITSSDNTTENDIDKNSEDMSTKDSGAIPGNLIGSGNTSGTDNIMETIYDSSVDALVVHRQQIAQAMGSVLGQDVNLNEIERQTRENPPGMGNLPSMPGSMGNLFGGLMGGGGLSGIFGVLRGLTGSAGSSGRDTMPQSNTAPASSENSSGGLAANLGSLINRLLGGMMMLQQTR